MHYNVCSKDKVHIVFLAQHTHRHRSASPYTQEHKGIFGVDGYVKHFVKIMYVYAQIHQNVYGKYEQFHVSIIP